MVRMANKSHYVNISFGQPLSLPASTASVNEPAWKEEENRETPHLLKDKQTQMEQEVYRMWT